MIKIEQVEKFLNLKCEGEYWDFKQEWYQTDKLGNLVHDIICMANNQCDEEAYIIIGVEDKTFSVLGVDNDPNRKNTQQITDLLRGINFIGGTRPMVHIDTIEYNGKTLDIIVIEKSNNTPYVLKDRYRDVNMNNVYTRVNDTNTPINQTADIDKQEYLWRKRFGINRSIMDQLNAVLDDWGNWGYYNDKCDFINDNDFGDGNIIFNRFFPEFRMELEKDSINEWNKETIMCYYANPSARSYKCNIYYNNTIIYSLLLCYVDEARKCLVYPETNSYYIKDNLHFYYYIIINSVKGKIQKILTNGSFKTDSRGQGKYWLLYLKDEDELSNFNQFATDSDSYVDDIKNGEYEIGTEKRYAHIPMKDIN
ncbi:MAG: ATP-binding protein, partial [Roseburia sp.]|nr:ATP-binding protein [Roseburia sp.]